VRDTEFEKNISDNRRKIEGIDAKESELER
jgi:hypothetical protein